MATKGQWGDKEVLKEEEAGSRRSLSISMSSVEKVKNGGGEHLEFKNDNKKRKERFVTKVKISWSFISFLISIADVTVIIYLSYLHFHHNSDVTAWLMLLPILLNFIGMFTFLSHDEERKEMQALGCERLKNLMFFPVIGPSVSALKLFAFSLEEKNVEKFERFESLLMRMKQYESFFRAAPEAFIQITFRIISWSRVKTYHAEDHWTSLCIALSLFAIAESHMYGPIISYYHMFERITTKDAWRVDRIGISWRIGLFFFTYLSAGSRIFADAILKATACFYFENRSFGEVIIICFICQFFIRAALYGLYNWRLGSMDQQKKLSDEGVYSAFTYSWRCLFMCFDYQSWCIAVFLWFYFENILMIISSYLVVYLATDTDLGDKYIFHIYAGQTVVWICIAISLKCFVIRKWRRGNRNQVLILPVP